MEATVYLPARLEFTGPWEIVSKREMEDVEDVEEDEENGG